MAYVKNSESAAKVPKLTTPYVGIKLVYTDAMHAKACTVPAAAMSKVS